jgi:hypothetical protein
VQKVEGSARQWIVASAGVLAQLAAIAWAMSLLF